MVGIANGLASRSRFTLAVCVGFGIQVIFHCQTVTQTHRGRNDRRGRKIITNG